MVTASYGHYDQRAARIGPDRIWQIRLPVSDSVPFFQRRHGSHCAKPTRIRSGWPCQGFWPNGSGLEASWGARIIGPGFWQGATGPLPVCHFQTQLQSSTDVPDHIVQNQPGSDLVLSDCARFWPNGSGPEASRCAGIIRPASGQSFPADPDWVQPVYWGLILMAFRLRRPSHPPTPAPKNLTHSVRTSQQYSTTTTAAAATTTTTSA